MDILNHVILRTVSANPQLKQLLLLYGVAKSSVAPHTKNPHNPSLSRFELIPQPQTFCGKPKPLYSTQHSVLFVTYQEGFNMHTGQPYPQSMINEYISGQIVCDTSRKQFVFQH